MSPPDAPLQAFAYGEDLDALSGRSLGYRLLAPPRPAPWSAEVEFLARHLQGAPYPEHWPPTDLFCSVVLASGQRMVAVARYGLVDHTANQRRGGLELIGVVGPADLDVPSARAIYHWLKKRREETDNLRDLDGTFSLAEAVANPPPLPSPADPTPVLPVRLWQEGALLFAATTPSDPDHRLNLLEQGAGGTWQWLPLVGPDFPIPSYAQHGPLLAWTPHLAGVALKLDKKLQEGVRPPVRGGRLFSMAALLLLLVLVVLTGLNLWLTLSLSRQAAAAGTVNTEPTTTTTAPTPATHKELFPLHPAAADESRERFARALHDLIVKQGGARELTRHQAELLAQYDRLVKEQPDLRLKDNNVEGREAVGAVGLLCERSAERVKKLVEKALDRKFDHQLIEVVSNYVYDQLSEDYKESP